MLLNNNGVYKTPRGMAQVDHNAYVNVAITLRGEGIRSASEWTTDCEGRKQIRSTFASLGASSP
ncbi:MAG TPA: hypothetical protein VFO99_11380 [Pyrinomonadaceae bacterium]|nr:hypothetical protein [Pyrinomonadaceae bacterium]